MTNTIQALLGTIAHLSGSLANAVTLDPNNCSGTITLSGANLIAADVTTGTYDAGVTSTTAKNAGQWYWETAFQQFSTNGVGFGSIACGIAASSYAPGNALDQGIGPTAMVLFSTGNVSLGGSIFVQIGEGPSGSFDIAENDIIAFALDIDAGLFWARDVTQNGYWNGGATADPATGAGGVSLSAYGLGPGPYKVLCGVSSPNTTANLMQINFGTTAIVGALPAGFSTWSPFVTPPSGLPVQVTGGPGLHLYWRLNITDSNNTFFTGIGELEMINYFGPNLCSGGTVSSPTAVYQTNVPANAIDGYTNSEWIAQSGSAIWVYEFAAPVEINKLNIWASTNDADLTIKDFTLDYSDDGSSWTTAITVTGQTGWAANELRTFLNSSVTPDTYSGSPQGSHKYWSVLCFATSGGSGGTMGMAEVQLLDHNGGTNQSTGGTATADAEYSGTYVAANAFDQDPNTAWMVTLPDQHNIYYETPSPIFVGAVGIETFSTASGINHANAPSTFAIRLSDDGVAWATIAWVTTASWTSAGQTQVFTDPAYI